MKKYLLLFLGLTVLCCTAAGASDQKVDARTRKLEAKADKLFINGDYDRAMKTYEQASGRLEGEPKDDLQLKMARLYILLQMPDEAIVCYDAVRKSEDTKLTINDICFFIDALRQKGDVQRAEIVARQYAFKSPYSRNQRYINALNSLGNQQYYYNKGESDFGVKPVQAGPLPEYWLGEWEGKTFYAVSHSRMQDPLKIFYHQTEYLSLDNKGVPDQFRNIPRELQSGPVAFSADKTRMIATGIAYRNSDRIRELGTDSGMFVNQLYYSVIDKGGSRWSSMKPLFEHQEGFNYAHPTFFNDGKSMVFSSDRFGGYGGMDLYISHWDEAAQKWGEPENMGPLVNTEGDEIYPRIINSNLYFSSNGLEGYGGYDIYRVSFGRNTVVPGSLFHYPYPINSVHNDFGVFFDGITGYFVSDRNGSATKDDIYSFDNSVSALNNDNVVGVSAEYSALNGNLNEIMGLMSSNNQTFEKDIYGVAGRSTFRGEILLSVYFEFNRYNLDRTAVSELNELLANRSLASVSELYIIGYADDIGGTSYNLRLSQQRAESVAKFLRDNSRNLPLMHVEGRGQLSLSEDELSDAMAEQFPGTPRGNYELSNASSPFSYQDRIAMNSVLRRVDIMVSPK